MVCLLQMFSKRLVSFSMWIDRTRWARNTWAMAAIFVLTMAVIADMVRLKDILTNAESLWMLTVAIKGMNPFYVVHFYLHLFRTERFHHSKWLYCVCWFPLVSFHFPIIRLSLSATLFTAWSQRSPLAVCLTACCLICHSLTGEPATHTAEFCHIDAEWTFISVSWCTGMDD